MGKGDSMQLAKHKSTTAVAMVFPIPAILRVVHNNQQRAGSYLPQD
jgi:hypothetical protein